MSSDDDKTQTHIVLTKDTEVGHYRIIEKIGAGGMGEVYLAEDTKLNRRVALKFLPPHLCQDEDCRERFKREAQAVAKLNHPNVVTIYEVSEYQGRPFFSMELVEGQSLRDVVAGKDLSIDRILGIAIQICEGLQAAHDKAIIHRDIKPSNILIDSHSRVRIVDFGLAAIQGGEQITKTGSTLGTIGYMSPEQVQGKDVDHRSDLFSLGVVLYELITKQNPFKRDNEAATFMAVSEDTPHPVARYRADMPEGLQAVIDKALDKGAKTRYQHADEMLSDLMRVKRSLESGQSTVSVASPARSFARPWWIAAGLVAVITTVALVTKPWVTEPVFDASEKIMLAVLPFENLGSAEDEYFADGMTDEITARLARVHDLGVICRSSSMRFKGSEKSLRQIGKELGVNYVVTGTVRWQNIGGDTSLVRVTPQLVRVEDESQIWAEIYSEKLTEVFSVQAKIAKTVVGCLDVSLLDEEKQALENRPTENMEAYRFYLRGRDYWSRYSYDYGDLDRAMGLLERAVELDTTFAEAYAALSTVYSWCHWIGYDEDSDMLMLAEEAAERAVRYDSFEGYSRAALGALYYWGYQDYPRALKELYMAKKRLPNSSEVMAMAAYIERRLGNWDISLDLQKKAHELAPFHSWISEGIMECTVRMRRWSDAAKYVERALNLFPDQSMPYYQKARLILHRDGDYTEARRALQSAPSNLRTSIYLMQIMVQCDYFARDYVKALETVRAYGKEVKTASDSAIYFYRLADLHRLLGRKDSIQIYYELALKYTQATHTESRVFSTFLTPSAGLIYAEMGSYEEAVKVGLAGLAQFPLPEDHVWGAWMMEQMALIYTKVGEFDQALNLLDTLLSMPSETSVGTLKGDPNWDPLRDHPRFQILINKYEKEHGI